MKRLDRYIIRELALPFCIGITIGVLLLIGTMLFQIADLIIYKRVPVTLVAKFMLLKAPSFAVIAMPMAMAFASSLAINRLARDSELTPVRMAGVSFRRIVAPIFAVGLVGSLFSYVMAEKVAPWANGKGNRIYQQIMLQSVAPTIQPNIFLQTDDRRLTLYIGWLNKIDNDHYLLKNVLVYDTGRGTSFPIWYVAKTAYTTRRFWTLRDVVRRDIGPDGTTVNETYLPELPLDLQKDVNFLVTSKTTDEMTGPELRDQIKQLQGSGQGSVVQAYEVDYHFRFSLPLACLVFGLISAPVSFRFSRGGTFVGVLVSIVIGFLYWNAMILSKLLGAHGVLPPVVAAWAQNVLFGAIAAVFVWRAG